jgi:hypothetical protein
MLRSVGNFFAGFTIVVGIAASIWLLAAVADASHNRLSSGDAAQAHAAPAAVATRAPVKAGEGERGENRSQNLDPASVWMSLRTPFGVFNFGLERDRL